MISPRSPCDTSVVLALYRWGPHGAIHIPGYEGVSVCFGWTSSAMLARMPLRARRISFRSRSEPDLPDLVCGLRVSQVSQPPSVWCLQFLSTRISKGTGFGFRREVVPSASVPV